MENMVTKGIVKVGGEIHQEFGINIYTLLYVKYINNKGLLYNTGNYIQYIVKTYNGNIYMYIASHIYTHTHIHTHTHTHIYIYIYVMESLCLHLKQTQPCN